MKKKLILPVIIGLTFYVNSSIAQQTLQIVKEPHNNQEAARNTPVISFTLSRSNQPDLVKYNLNDANMSFRTSGECRNCYVQLFEHFNYEGQSEFRLLPTGVLTGTKWANTISSFQVFEQRSYGINGGDGGGSFKDSPPSPNYRLYTVNVWSGEYIDAIQLIWIDKDGNITTGQKHGGNGGGLTSITLRDGEHINRIYGRSGSFVDFLSFRTNLGRTFNMGGNGGGDFDVEFGREGIMMGILGRCGAVVDALGFWGYWDSPGARAID